MKGAGSQGRTVLVHESPLRPADPRVKLAVSLIVSLAVMLPLNTLLVAIGLYFIFLGWARLLPAAGRLLWRLKWVLLILFVVDWWLVSLELACLVSLRIMLLSGAFAILFATTTPEEFRLALEWLGLPYRYAFSLGLAVQSIGLLATEWRAVVEAQQVRGAWAPLTGWRSLARQGLLWQGMLKQVRDLVALAVPAVVMTTHRAWAMTEAAHARGFDSPSRTPFRRLRMGRLDWALLAAAVLVAVALVVVGRRFA